MVLPKSYCMTAGDIDKAFNNVFRNSFARALEELRHAPAEHMVLYFRKDGTYKYVPPEEFYLGPPADSVFSIFSGKKK